MKITYKYRIKDSVSKKQLAQWASVVNFVWNYCRETVTKAWRLDRCVLSGFDLKYLTTGSYKELNLPAQTIQAICEQFTWSRFVEEHDKVWESIV